MTASPNAEADRPDSGKREYSGAIREALEVIESEEYFKYPFEIARRFVELRKLAEQSGEHPLAEEFQRDNELFSLVANDHFRCRDSFTRRFSECCQSEDGAVWPDPDADTTARAAHCVSRLSTFSNPFLTSRYLDYVFEHGVTCMKLKRIDLLPQLLDSCHATARKHISRDAPFYLGALKSLDRSTYVSIALGNRAGLRSCINAIGECMDRVESQKVHKWLLDISRITRGILASPLGNELTGDEIAKFRNALADARCKCWEGRDYYLHRSFVREEILIGRICGDSDEDIRGLQLEIGESYESDAAHREGDTDGSGHGLRAASLYEKAMKHYADIGEADRMNSMKVKIKTAYRTAEDDGEFYQVTVPIQIPWSECDELMNSALNHPTAQDALRYLSESMLFVPEPEHVREIVQAVKEASPLIRLLNWSVIDGDLKVATASKEDEKDRLEYLQQYGFVLRVAAGAEICPVFERLLEEKGLSADDIMEVLTSWPFMRQQNAALVQTGLDRFFAGDYVSALHVLVPQLEGLLRAMFSQAGYPTTSIKPRGVQQEQTLSDFLHRSDVRKVLGGRFGDYYGYIMVEQTGLNLRNKIAHGLIEPRLCNRRNSIMVIHLLICMTCYVPASSE